MNQNNPKPTFLGKLVIFTFIAACFYSAYLVYMRTRAPAFQGTSGQPSSSAGPVKSSASGPVVQIGIAYGTEKKRWLESAVEEFAKTDAGQRIRISLIPLGSLEAAQAILRNDNTIHVWSPASALYKDTFVTEWGVKHDGRNPIRKEEQLALTPMVFVTWAERQDAFLGKYKELNFETVNRALAEKTGWMGIAQKPEWGLFKFGHTNPNDSNSGLGTLLLMAYTFHDKTRDLSLKDLLDPKFQEWMIGIENAVTGMSSSTGTMMKEMVLKGPSSFDSLFVYESVAIDFMKNAEGRWGELRVSYPQHNFWNDNPYYILDVPWSSAEQQRGAEEFMAFLLSEPIQQKSIAHGFRPANAQVPVKFQGSPFTAYERYGIKQDIGQPCQPPKAEVINNLLQLWQRSRTR